MSKTNVGGQAVMEGVMMRARDKVAIAVRKPDGGIVVEERPWISFTRRGLLKKPFVRGFPILLETLVNGIKALNFSAQQALDEDEGELGAGTLVLTMVIAIALALGLFVVLPHVVALAMSWIGLGGGVNDLSFHAWDGFYKLAIFLAYLIGISFIPDVKRVFQYHGAEHKVIRAFEDGRELTAVNARGFSRLHPRCGTAFLLFVLSLSILLYAFLVPLMLKVYSPDGKVIRQAYIILMKFLLMVPISGMAYEMIKVAGKYQKQVLCRMMCWPGLALQLMTTKEPDDSQLEVAIAALNGAVGKVKTDVRQT